MRAPSTPVYRAEEFPAAACAGVQPGTYRMVLRAFVRACCLLLCLLALTPGSGGAQSEYVDPSDAELGAFGARITAHVDSSRFVETLRGIVGDRETRSFGTGGNEAATQYIAGEFSRIGLDNIKTQALSLPVARQHYAYALLPRSDEPGAPCDTLRLCALMPNWARTNTIGPDGLPGRIVYVREGREREFNGHEMTGSILLAEALVEDRWRLAASLGSRAAIFIDSPDPTIVSGGSFLTSVNFPRFRVSREDGDLLRDWAERHPGREITLHAKQPWEPAYGRNVAGFLPGSDPVLASEVIVVTAPFDASSIVEGIAPGAEAAFSAAALIEMARILHDDRPPRSIYFAALNGQRSGEMLGGREFVLALKRSNPEAYARNAELLRKDIRLIADRRLADLYPDYRQSSAQLEGKLNAVLSNEHAEAQRRWNALQQARTAYLRDGAVAERRRGADLAAERLRLAGNLQRAADEFLPAFAAATAALRPVIADFGTHLAEFVDLMERDRERLLPIIAEGEDKLRSTIEERLAAARLMDVDKALNRATNISASDHTSLLEQLEQELALIAPMLHRFPALLVDLSLTTGTPGVGVSYKGHFYNQHPDLELRRDYSPLGRRFDGYAISVNIVHDLERLWSMSDEEIRALIQSKLDAIGDRRASYQAIAHLTTHDLEETYSYSIHHRVFNATAWLWALLGAAAFFALRWRWKKRNEGDPPRWFLIAAGVCIAGSLYALVIGVDTKNTTRVYGGINTLIWEHTDLLVNAARIPREDRTRIRIAAERQQPYTEMTEAPGFFADNVIAAIPATINALRIDSVMTSTQLDEFESLQHLRGIPAEALTDSQLVSITKFVRFLGLAGERHFVDAVAGLPGKSWSHFLPSARFFTSEIATLGGMPAVALSTLDDRALLLGTINDRIEFMDFGNAHTQLRTIAAVLGQALADPYLPDDFELRDYYAETRGDVLYDDRVSSVTADVPIANAIVLADRRMYAFRALSDQRGSFRINGLPIDGRSWVRSGDEYWVHAYRACPDSGHINLAVDVGNEQYEFTPRVSQRHVDWMFVVFDCASVSVTNIMDQRYFQYLSAAEAYDARTDARPWHSFTHISHGDNTFFVDPGTRVKFVFRQGMLGIRAMLTNVPEEIGRPEHRQGIGFPVGSETLLTHTTYQAAHDMWQLNSARLATLIRHGIIDENTREVHEQTKAHLAAAREARDRGEYSTYLTEARTALALESRVLPDILATANGALKGVLFYMALLLPFAFFMERLIIGSVDVRKQAMWFFMIFIAMFVLIERVHPAFDITTAPPMVLLAFTVFALSIFVMFVIIGKFTTQMQQMRKEQQGYLSADVGRISAMFTAFLLGVSNMRKRKIRTALTCATLVILTFTVLSFTSVTEVLRVNRINLSTAEPVYTGFLIRDRGWNFWPRETLPSIENEFGEDNIVVGRAWREAFTRGSGFVFTLEAENGRRYSLSGFVGMEPEEDEVTGIFRKTGIAGRWFNHDDLYALVIPRSIADALHIPHSDVTGDIESAPKVKMEGVEYAIVGVLDDEAVRALADLDGEPLTSVDWSLASQQRTGRTLAPPTDQARDLSERDSFIHLVPGQCIFMPLRGLTIGGGLVSVAVKTPSSEHATGLVESVIPKWALEMYVGERRGTYLYSAVGLTTLGGLGDVAIPILIAALIVLNTMLSAVYERTREIGIFSSVGLAPSHIAMLFMAESVVYAVIGAIAGYVMGQTVGQLVYQTGLLGGITLNYSSLSAVASTIIVMATVLLSTMWPARKASQLSVPDIARNWKLPEPQGDDWYFDLPFTLLDEELEGVNAFLTHFFEQHHDESSSDFYIDRVDFWTERGRFMLETMAWVAPYDLGVSQLVTLITTPVPDEPGLYQMSLLVTRESGDLQSWVRVNRRFVNFLRKQLLIWRSLTPEERGTFIERGREMFSVDGRRAIETTAMASA